VSCCLKISFNSIHNWKIGRLKIRSELNRQYACIIFKEQYQNADSIFIYNLQCIKCVITNEFMLIFVCWSNGWTVIKELFMFVQFIDRVSSISKSHQLTSFINLRWRVQVDKNFSLNRRLEIYIPLVIDVQ